MLITGLSLGEEVNNLDLRGKIMKGDSMIPTRAPGKVSIHADVLGQLMLDRIDDNLKGTSAVIVKRSGGDNRKGY